MALLRVASWPPPLRRVHCSPVTTCRRLPPPHMAQTRCSNFGEQNLNLNTVNCSECLYEKIRDLIKISCLLSCTVCTSLYIILEDFKIRIDSAQILIQ